MRCILTKGYCSGILLVIIFLSILSGCSKSSREKNICDFFEDLEEETLQLSFQKALSELKSKQRVLSEKINSPDSMLLYFTDKKNRTRFTDKCVSGYPFFMIKKFDSIAILNGLESEYYNITKINKMLSGLYSGKWKKDPPKYADSAVALMIFTADALSSIYSDIGKGRLEPGFSGDLYYIKRRSCKGKLFFLSEENYQETLNKVLPNNKYYLSLRQELGMILKYKDSIRGALRIPATLIAGDILDQRTMRNLCYRLKIKNCLDQPDSIIGKLKKVPRFLVSSIRNFQELSGLPITGKPDKNTLEKLNFNVAECTTKLKSSMERLRWCEISDSPQSIFVNIASNLLFAFRNDSLVMEMKVCSGESKGKKYYELLEKSKAKGKSQLAPVSHETPVIQSEVSYFTVNPKWNVPHNILIKEMLGMVRNNPTALMRMGYTLKDNKGGTINPETINWKEFNPSKPGFRLVQNAGDGNALGKLIIHFNNPYSIYMHDTPSKWAFSETNRNVSHGCIRLEKPFDLLEYISTVEDKKKKWLDKALITAGFPPKQDTALLRKWKEEKDDTTIKKEFLADKSTGIKNKIPVNILYLTAYPYKSNFIRYTADPYAGDKELMEAMQLK